MNSTTKKGYEAPSLNLGGDVISATRAKVTGSLEPSQIKPRFGSGEIGFGL